VFRKTFTKPLPAGAETFVRKGQRFGRWKDRKGKTRTAPLTVGKDGSERVVIESPYYVAKYRDGAGVVQVSPTGCRDETAARRVLADLERRAELVRSGVMSNAEAAVVGHQGKPLAEHLDAFAEHLRAKGDSEIHRSYTRRYLDRLARECPLTTLADLRREVLERWLAARTNQGVGAKARNDYRGALITFCNWCVATHRLTSNPFVDVPKANQKADRRRQRRAMTETELVRLLDVARHRPLLDTMTVRKGPRRGEAYAMLRPETRDRLELLGWERALIYKTFLLTGLRKGELASLTVAQLHLEGLIPYAALHAADEKNREGNEIVIRDDLAADLRDWLADKLRRFQDEARQFGEPIPMHLPPDTPLFAVPAGLLRIFNRDLRRAGIPKRDERGRTLDLHAMRTTLSTLLNRAGVAPRTAQAAMRHSDIRLTMETYTDPKLLDVRGALDVLPALPLDGGGAAAEAARATGTDAALARTLAPVLAPTSDKPGKSESIADKTGGERAAREGRNTLAASGHSGKGKDPLTTPVSGPVESGREDLNLRPHGPESRPRRHPLPNNAA
jgi:integrase